MDGKSLSGGAAPLLVRTQGSDRSLPAGPSYLIGRDPECDIVIADIRVSWHHAVLRLENGRWVLADNGSTNGTYARGQRVDRIEIDGECQARLGNPTDGPVLGCTVSGDGQAPPDGEPSVARRLSATTLRIGRAPENDIVVSDPTVSRQHAEIRNVSGAYRIVDLDSSHGTFLNGQRVTDEALSEGDIVRVGSSTFRLAGQELQEVSDAGAEEAPPAAAEEAPPRRRNRASPPRRHRRRSPPHPAPRPGSGQAPTAAPPGDSDGALEIPYAIRWLVPKGERFANFHILNDNDTQLDYYRRFGHIYAVGVPAKKWRLVVVSDPELLDEVAADEEQFGKRVEEINFFAQLSNSRGGGISVIGDGEHTEQIRRVMLPWYSPLNQRTQLGQMKDQARKLVAAWSAIPDDEPIDARAWMERYTLEVSGRGACNYDFGLLDGSGEPHPFAVAVPESTKESIRRVADARPDFTLFAGRARARAAKALPPSQQGAVHERPTRSCAPACTPARSGSRRICSPAW